MTEKRNLPNLHPGMKLLIAIVVSSLAYILTLSTPMELYTRLMIGWDVLGLTYILISVFTLFNTHSSRIRNIAQQQDMGHFFLFGLMVLASLGCLIAIALLVKSNQTWLLDKITITIIYLTGSIVCWLMLHIVFTFHYAHLYYGNDLENKNTHRGGLGFPGSAQPNYMDFAYFSFVIGMTFQVSDVVVTDRKIRQVVLFHALIAFLFNTVIVALSVNAIVNSGL